MDRPTDRPIGWTEQAKYGFASVEDWPALCDYEGPFRYDLMDRQNAKGMEEAPGGLVGEMLRILGER